MTSTSILFSVLLLPSVLATPKAIDVIQSAGHLEEHQPNFCNRTDLANENGLSKTSLGQFLGYPCSADFFHCRWQSDGYRTYKKSCRVGLVFDTAGTQNCNYDYNVKGCAITSNPEKCANVTDFSCPLSEHCVSLGQRCDGIYDCVLEEDEQNCPMCKQDEFPCVKSEQCIPMSGRCNGIQECKDGTDEQDCDICGPDNFFCRKSGKCVPAAQRCDGIVQCPQGEDELLCKRQSNQFYVCENRQTTIPRDLVCNGRPECPDGSDEKYCGAGTGPTSGLPEKSIEENTISENPDSIGGTILGQPPSDLLAAAAAGVANGGIQLPSNAPPGTGKLAASFPRINFNGHSEEEQHREAIAGSDETANSDTIHDSFTAADPSFANGPAIVDVADGNAASSTHEAHSGHIEGEGAPEALIDSAIESTAKTQSAGPQLMHMKKYRQPADKLVNPSATVSMPVVEIEQEASTVQGVPCIPNTHIQQPQQIIECVPCQPCIQLPTELPSYVGQEGRKTFAPPTTVNFYRTESPTPSYEHESSTTTTASVDPLQELSEKYGTNRADDDYSELLKKIEQILRNESSGPSTKPELQKSFVPIASGSVFPPPFATTIDPPFHRMPKTIHVTGRPHKWHPSLSTNQHFPATTPVYRRRLNGHKTTNTNVRTLHTSPAL